MLPPTGPGFQSNTRPYSRPENSLIWIPTLRCSVVCILNEYDGERMIALLKANFIGLSLTVQTKGWCQNLKCEPTLYLSICQISRQTDWLQICMLFEDLPHHPEVENVPFDSKCHFNIIIYYLGLYI